MKDKKRRNSNSCKECNNYRLSYQNKHMRRGNKHEKEDNYIKYLSSCFYGFITKCR